MHPPAPITARSSAVFLTGANPGTGAEAELGISVDQVARETHQPGRAVAVAGARPSRTAASAAAPGFRAPTGTPFRGRRRSRRCRWRTIRRWSSSACSAMAAPRRNAPRVVQQARSLLDSIMGEVGVASANAAGARPRRASIAISPTCARSSGASRLPPSRCRTSLKLPDAPSGIPDDFDAHVKLMFDLQVLAWQADVTRVTTLMFAKEVSNAVFPASGIREPFHNLSHHSNVPDNITRLAQLNQYHAKHVRLSGARSCTRPPDGDGTLLDHSLVLYGSGMSNSNQHDHDPLPIVVAGGAAGKAERRAAHRVAGRRRRCRTCSSRCFRSWVCRRSRSATARASWTYERARFLARRPSRRWLGVRRWRRPRHARCGIGDCALQPSREIRQACARSSSSASTSMSRELMDAGSALGRAHAGRCAGKGADPRGCRGGSPEPLRSAAASSGDLQRRHRDGPLVARCKGRSELGR